MLEFAYDPTVQGDLDFVVAPLFVLGDLHGCSAHDAEIVVVEHLLQRSAPHVALQVQEVTNRTVDRLDDTEIVDRDRARIELIHHRFEKEVGSGLHLEEALILDGEVVVIDRPHHQLLELLLLPGFRKVRIDVAAVDGLDDRLHVGEAGEDHSDRRRMALAHLRHELDTAHAGHTLVGQHDRDGRFLVQDVEGAAGVGRGVNLVIVREGEHHRFEDGFLVIDDQNAGEVRHGKTSSSKGSE